MYGFVEQLGHEITKRLKERKIVQDERAELEPISSLIYKPKKTKETVE